MRSKYGRMARQAAAIVMALALIAGLAGCKEEEPGSDQATGGTATAADKPSESGSGEKKPGQAESKWEPYEPDENEKAMLTVMYVNEGSFYQDYGNLFTAKYPNVEFKVVPLSETRGEGDMLSDYKAAMDTYKPDILLMNETQYEALAAEGRLLELEVPIKAGKFDLAGMVPGVIDMLKDLGDGRLYGLANKFKSKALYYNKTLFNEYGVPYPEPGMSWEDVLKLAGRFPATGQDGEPIYGLFQPTFTLSPFHLVQQIGKARKLTAFDTDGKTLLFGSDSWASVFEQVVEGYKAGHIFYPNAPLRDNGDGTFSLNLGGGNMFIAGKAAMAVDDLLTMQMMDFGARSKDGGDQTAFEWDIVPMPVDPLAPNSTTEFELPEIFAVNRESAQMALAWEFIQYIHSENYMRMISKSSTDLLARTGFETDQREGICPTFTRCRRSSQGASGSCPPGSRTASRKLPRKRSRRLLQGMRLPMRLCGKFRSAASSCWTN